MPGNHVYAVFRLHDMPSSQLEREGLFNPKIFAPHVGILGSIPELGSWNFEKHVRASPMTKFDKWEVKVLIPAEVTFEWSWIVLDNRILRVKHWDPFRSRTTTIGKIGGTIHVAWGRGTQMFLSDTCGVEVTLDYHCSPGQYLVVTGGEPALGNWNPYFGVEGREEFPPGSGKWRAHLVLEKLYHYQWKWVVVQGPHRHVVRWEEGFTHMIWMDSDVDRMEVRTLWEAKDYHDVIQTHVFRLKPDFEERMDERELLTIRENMDAMHQMNGRCITESKQPKKHRGRNTKRATQNKKAGRPTPSIEAKKDDTGSGKKEQPKEKQGFFLFRWIGNAISAYLDLIE